MKKFPGVSTFSTLKSYILINKGISLIFLAFFPQVEVDKGLSERFFSDSWRVRQEKLDKYQRNKIENRTVTSVGIWLIQFNFWQSNFDCWNLNLINYHSVKSLLFCRIYLTFSSVITPSNNSLYIKHLFIVLSTLTIWLWFKSSKLIYSLKLILLNNLFSER